MAPRNRRVASGMRASPARQTRQLLQLAQSAIRLTAVVVRLAADLRTVRREQRVQFKRLAQFQTGLDPKTPPPR